MNQNTFWQWLDALTDIFDTVHEWFFVHLVQPTLPLLGLIPYTDDAFLGSQWFLIGVLEILTIWAVLRPLERIRPFEPIPRSGPERQTWRHDVRIDILYTLIDRLGILRVGIFLLLGPLWNALFGWLAVHDIGTGQLDQWMAPWWPGVTDQALFGFLVYVVLLDAANYWIHRFQHRWTWWWALHAVHHSQRHMTAWSDSRTHMLDIVLVEVLFVLLARLIGVPTDQFVLLAVLFKLSESLAHANLNLSFGRWGQYLWVGPRFHRVHHSIDLGSTPQEQHLRFGCNYAVLLPLWDALFGSAQFHRTPGPTGIHDQLPEAGGVDYGHGFWRQQTTALARLARALRPQRAQVPAPR